MVDGCDLQRAGIWRQELERFLSTKSSRYTLVEHRSLVGIVMFVYVREKHMRDGAVKDVQVRAYARHRGIEHPRTKHGGSRLTFNLCVAVTVTVVHGAVLVC